MFQSTTVFVLMVLSKVAVISSSHGNNSTTTFDLYEATTVTLTKRTDLVSSFAVGSGFVATNDVNLSRPYTHSPHPYSLCLSDVDFCSPG